MTTSSSRRERSSRLGRAYADVRNATTALAAPLSAEDMQVQSMPDASPTKWHLAHTTWFFETFVLARFEQGFTPFDRDFGFLFNSYYEALGPRPLRGARGLVTRPSLDEVRAYRASVDGRIETLIATCSDRDLETIASLVTLGMNHEQQHQELLLTDIHHVLWSHPLRPAYDVRALAKDDAPSDGDAKRVRFDGGVVSIGYDGAGFAFDNETPRHRVFLEPFAIASRAVTNREVAAFVADGGYTRADLWLSDGWSTAHGRGWEAPIYWEKRDGAWHEHTLHGVHPLAMDAPASHLSFYEADAYARWAGARLPSEAEWEHASRGIAIDGNLLESGALVPRAAKPTIGAEIAQMFGDVWEWTASPYVAYPRFKPLEGALGEYNGKFMCNQIVLRGGSCFTPRSHIRSTYRNFFPPDARWQMSGLRLAWWA